AGGGGWGGEEGGPHGRGPRLPAGHDARPLSEQIPELAEPLGRRRHDRFLESDRLHRVERPLDQRPPPHWHQGLGLGPAQPASAAGGGGEKQKGHGWRRLVCESPAQTARISFSLPFSSSSTSVIFRSVSFWDSSRPRLSSSSEICLSLSIFFNRSLPS